MIRMTGEYVGGAIAGAGIGWILASSFFMVWLASIPHSLPLFWPAWLICLDSAAIAAIWVGGQITRRAQQRKADET